MKNLYYPLLFIAIVLSLAIITVVFRRSKFHNLKNPISLIKKNDNRNTIIWSNDFHISPIANIKKLNMSNALFIDKSLSGHCHLTQTCATNLRILTKDNGISPDYFTKANFVRSYRNDNEIAMVDIFMCFHPAAMCELFLPFKKRIFVIATTRYELGREDPVSWRKWNKNLQLISENSRNLIAANNLYDAKYIEYFTGIRTRVLPSWIPVENTYNPRSSDILITNMHIGNAQKEEIWSTLKNLSPRFKDMKTKYQFYTYPQLCENTAIFHLPYQISVMSLFEQYAMGIPILVPSPEFLWTLHDKYGLVSERTWATVRTGKRPSKSPIPSYENTIFKKIPDPNNDLDRDSFLYWIKFADYYQWPYIIQFSSWEDLGDKIEAIQYEAISKSMREFHSKELTKTRKVIQLLIN